MIAWMIYSLVVGTLIALAAIAVERGARRLELAGRWAWAAAIALTVVVSVTAFWRPGTAPSPERPVRAEAAVEATTVDPMALVASESGFLGVVRERAAALAVTLRATLDEATKMMRQLVDQAMLDRGALALWIVVSLTVAGMIVLAALRLARARRQWGLEVIDDQFVRVSEDVGPAVVGFVRGEIVVPAWVLDLPPDRRAMLMAHEREHVRARDPLLLLGALGALVLMPWNPALWWQVRRLRLAVEMDCDRRVLRCGSDVRAYGALLIEVGRRSARAPLAAAAFSEPATHLERRIHTMLARPPRWRALRATALALAGAAILAVACDMQPPMGPEPEREVALAELAYTSRSYNVKEGLPPAVIRELLVAHHPELLRDQGGRKWVVSLVFDTAGRLVSTGKSEVEERRVIASKGRPTTPPDVVVRESAGRRVLSEIAVEGRAERTAPRSIIVRANDGQIEAVEVEKRATAAMLEERRRVEANSVMLQADTVRLRMEGVEPLTRRVLRPTLGSGRTAQNEVVARGTGVTLDKVALDEPAARERVLTEVRARAEAGSHRRASGGSPLASITGARTGLEKVRPEDIESIEVIKGGIFTELAPALNGVIVVRLKH